MKYGFHIGTLPEVEKDGDATLFPTCFIHKSQSKIKLLPEVRSTLLEKKINPFNKDTAWKKVSLLFVGKHLTIRLFIEKMNYVVWELIS